MKNLFTALLSIVLFNAVAQDAVHARLNEAKGSYSAGNLEDARYSLQQSIAELDAVICKEIMAVLPKEVAGLKYLAEEDYVAGNAMGIVGSSVQRNYKNNDKTLNLTMMNNSPMLSMVTAFLTNPLFGNTADGSQKQIKIAGHKAVLQRNSEEDGSYTIQVPLNQSLLTLEYNKFTEPEAIKAAETINIGAIVEIIN